MTSQGIPRIVVSYLPEAGRSKEGFSSRDFEGSEAHLIP
jgi:hypothetical protein